MSAKPLNLMLDSGAYDAWRHGKPVDLGAYIACCRNHADVIEQPVSLDSIPGKPGQPRTRKMAEEAASRGWKNYRRMKKEGIDAMPVVHNGEDRSWIDRYAEAGATWIGLASGSRAFPDYARRVWLRGAFARLSRYPGVRGHGFSETRLEIMSEFPWYSVDSATWLRCAVNGQAFAPRWNGKREVLGLVFFGPCGRNDPHALRRFAVLHPEEQARVRAGVAAHAFTVESLADEERGTQNRAAFNAVVMDRWLRDRGSTVRLYFASEAGPDRLRATGLRDRLIAFDKLPRSGFDLRAYVGG
jgi:hypothetical protein